ncbi:uncharacterized protein LOC128952649 [Oppia nitens]|uniref:uncharacterized protein LOC128952649 n=1 Tax=Oppia nitens TaxID=1686743 RepID=UPI0023DA7ADE|nr:uncharacterized protein LOC128952649 [Oppia nitens]
MHEPPPELPIEWRPVVGVDDSDSSDFTYVGKADNFNGHQLIADFERRIGQVDHMLASVRSVNDQYIRLKNNEQMLSNMVARFHGQLVGWDSALDNIDDRRKSCDRQVIVRRLDELTAALIDENDSGLISGGGGGGSGGDDNRKMVDNVFDDYRLLCDARAQCLLKQNDAIFEANVAEREDKLMDSIVTNQLLRQKISTIESRQQNSKQQQNQHPMVASVAAATVVTDTADVVKCPDLWIIRLDHNYTATLAVDGDWQSFGDVYHQLADLDGAIYNNNNNNTVAAAAGDSCPQKFNKTTNDCYQSSSSSMIMMTKTPTTNDMVVNDFDGNNSPFGYIIDNCVNEEEVVTDFGGNGTTITTTDTTTSTNTAAGAFVRKLSANPDIQWLYNYQSNNSRVLRHDCPHCNRYFDTHKGLNIHKTVAHMRQDSRYRIFPTTTTPSSSPMTILANQLIYN